MEKWSKLWGGGKVAVITRSAAARTRAHTHACTLSNAHSVPLSSEKHEDKASGQRGVMVCQKGRRGKKRGGGFAPRVPPTAQTHTDTLLRGPNGRVGVSSSRLKSLLFLIRYFSSGESKVATQQKAGNPSNLRCEYPAPFRMSIVCVCVSLRCVASHLFVFPALSAVLIFSLTDWNLMVRLDAALRFVPPASAEF